MVRLVATADVPTAFARVGGFDGSPSHASAAASTEGHRAGMSLDVTGSLCARARRSRIGTAASDMSASMLRIRPKHRCGSRSTRSRRGQAEPYAVPATNKRAPTPARSSATAPTSNRRARRRRLPQSGRRQRRHAPATMVPPGAARDGASDYTARSSRLGRFRAAAARRAPRTPGWYSDRRMVSVWPVASRRFCLRRQEDHPACADDRRASYNTYGGQCDAAAPIHRRRRATPRTSQPHLPEMKTRTSRLLDRFNSRPPRRDVLRDCASRH